MSVFGSIMSKIFGGSAHAESAAPSAPSSAGGSTGATGSPGATGSTGGTGAAGASAGGAAASAPGGASVDVEKVVGEMAAKKGQTLNWKTSIVDLMKALDLDSGLDARKELAKELNYTGDTDDSATMNVWLHKQVMQKLAENGGKVPDSLRA